MKAVQVTKDGSGTTSVAVSDVPKPTPGQGELLIKVRASAVMPADVLNSKGGFGHTTFPRTLGKDFAGTVVEGPENLKGKHVFGTSGNSFSYTKDGGQAEYTVVSEGSVAPLPKNLTFAQAASLGTPFTTANLTLQRAGAQKGETVMVLGATGQVGGSVMQLASGFYGCKTISVGRHGTDINSTKDPELKSAKELTGGKGPDLVVDTVGDFTLTQAAIGVLAPGGRVSFVTAPRSGSTQLSVDILNLYRRQISLVGCNSVFPSQEESGAVLRKLAPVFEDGKLTAPDEDKMTLLPVDRALEAYEGTVKKAVIVFDE